MSTKYGVYGLDDSLTFGKYSGSQLYEVFDVDLKYIEYLIEENLIELDNEAFEQYRKLKKEDNE